VAIGLSICQYYTIKRGSWQPKGRGKREQGRGKRECTVGVKEFGVMELGVVKIPLSNSNSKLELSSVHLHL
jgi:hypothetical protein